MLASHIIDHGKVNSILKKIPNILQRLMRRITPDGIFSTKSEGNVTVARSVVAFFLYNQEHQMFTASMIVLS
jgi:hypothetical protein